MAGSIGRDLPIKEQGRTRLGSRPTMGDFATSIEDGYAKVREEPSISYERHT